MRFRSALMLGMLALLLGILVAALGTVAVVAQRSARAEVARDVEQSRKVVEDLQGYRQALLKSEAHVVAEAFCVRPADILADVARQFGNAQIRIESAAAGPTGAGVVPDGAQERHGFLLSSSGERADAAFHGLDYEADVMFNQTK